jgi:hypothetical protein
MEIADQGLPIHEDASLKIRPRIFLEGNFFVDLEPGSASAPILQEGERPIPITRTATPVQFGEVVSALQSDTRSDLQTFLREYSKALRGAGARGFNRSIRYWEQAYRGSALANDAALGIEPSADLPRVLRGQQRTFGALARDDPALQGLVSNFNTTAAALARESRPLQASLPALRDTLTVAQPALRSVNNALPELRAFATDALPGVRSSGPTLEQSVPFTRELRALVGPAELRGLARELRVRLPALVRLARRSVPLLGQNRALAACAGSVLAPFFQSRINDPDFPANSGRRVIEQAERSFVGLAGESRTNDANTPFYRIQLVSPRGLTQVRPAAPVDPNVPPPHRPDVPCETQQPPNLNAPGGPVVEFTANSKRGRPAPLRQLRQLFEAQKRKQARLWRKQHRLDAQPGKGSR